MTIYFTSDLHFGHDKEFLYEPRGFSSIQEHDEAIVSNINEIVRPEDTLYILGDLIMNDKENGREMLSRINCQDVKVILGNHDTIAKIDIYSSLGFEVIGYATMLKYGKRRFYLSHYPTMTANMDDDKKPWQRVWNLCGHWHTKNPYANFDVGGYHVELDAHDNYPVDIDTIINDIRDMNEKSKALGQWLNDEITDEEYKKALDKIAEIPFEQAVEF